MSEDASRPPESDRMYPGALLATVVHGIMIAQYPMLAHEQSWDGPSYNVQNSQGARGSVTFSDGHFVGVAFDAESPANPLRGNSQYDPELFFQGMPTDRRPIARRSLRYVHEDYRGKSTPVLTAAFWDSDGRVAAAAPWPDVLRHGARLFRRQLMSPEDALRQWSEDYEMSSEQLTLARELFRRRIPTREGKVEITNAEWSTILKYASAGSGARESRETLESIGFVVPEAA